MKLRPPAAIWQSLRELVAWCLSCVEFEEYTVATLPDPAGRKRWIYVRNETGGAVPAFNDGVNWRRAQDRAIVS